jgi:hypothetical protein
MNSNPTTPAAEPARVTIEGEGWHAILTPAELAAWDRYTPTHPHLLDWSYERTLAMFLSHLRRGIDLSAAIGGAR